ncbi:hypothetical protein N7465_006180 [Penicillium sp. CMV-2018d]|nr:hypothetical protein N7465_006180 [Penicillium sp. CMV-2018d]
MYLEAKQQLFHCQAFDITIKSIEPRVFLPPQCHVFPGSAGAKVLLTPDHNVRIYDNDRAVLAEWSIFYVVFPGKKSLEACWAKGVPDKVGSLHVGYILASLYGTADIVESGRAVSDTPGDCSMISKGPS